MATELQGTEQQKRLAKTLAAASRNLLPVLLQAADDAVRPLKVDIPRSALTTLPKRGGLGQRVAASEIKITKRGRMVRVTTSNGYALGRIDKGTVRHPVHARRDQPRSQWRWVNQQVKPGWWTKPTTAISPKVRRELERTLQRFTDDIGR